MSLFSLSLSLSLTHTHTHTHTLSLSLPLSLNKLRWNLQILSLTNKFTEVTLSTIRKFLSIFSKYTLILSFSPALSLSLFHKIPPHTHSWTHTVRIELYLKIYSRDEKDEKLIKTLLSIEKQHFRSIIFIKEHVKMASLSFHWIAKNPSRCLVVLVAKVSILFGLVWYYGISNILGYLMPNPFYRYILNV